MPIDVAPVAITMATALLAVLGYLGKRYVDFKLDAISKFHEAKFDAVVELKGLLTEIDHCALHIADGDSDYVELIRRHCEKARKGSRASSAVLGIQLIEKVRLSTDVAFQLADSYEPGLLRKWNSYRDELFTQLDGSIRSVELRP